jgi:dipeptidyl aminopeptidase/acylaminoacyl peptidase
MNKVRQRRRNLLQFLFSPVHFRLFTLLLAFLLATFSFAAFSPALWAQKRESAAAGKRAMTFDDAMRFRALEGATLSANGAFLGYIERPDRGDPTAVLQALDKPSAKTAPQALARIKRGSRILFSRDGRWAAVTIAPRYLAAEKAPAANRPDSGLCLVELANGKQTVFENVARAEFTDNSAWLAVHFTKNRKDRASATDSLAADSSAGKQATKQAPKKPSEQGANARKKIEPGATLLLRRLSSGEEREFPFVKEFALDSASRSLALAFRDTAQIGSLRLFDLQTATFGNNAPSDSARDAVFSSLRWTPNGDKLAFLQAVDATNGTVSAARLRLWLNADGGAGATELLLAPEQAPSGYVLPSKNTLQWSRDGKRLLFGFKPAEYHDTTGTPDPPPTDADEANLYNPKAILDASEVDVWSWNDDFINPHQKKRWEREKDRALAAVFDLERKTFVPVADRATVSVDFNEAHTVALTRSDAAHRKEATWAGFFHDAIAVNALTGARDTCGRKIKYASSLSPHGKFVAFYVGKHWFLYNVETKTTRNLTENLAAKFWNDEDDHPADPPPHGLAAWTVSEKPNADAALLLYDKHDVWRFSLPDGAATNLTANARKGDYALRIERLDTARSYLREGERVMILARSLAAKNSAIFAMTIAESARQADLKLLLEGKKRYSRIVKAERAPRLVFSQSAYNQFPDLWLTDSAFKEPKKITNLQEQVERFAWGEAELVEWRSEDGSPLQGVLIKPGNYERGKRYPVMVYFYEIMSDRLYDFQIPAVGSRPAFGLYASDGYAIFLPDVRYIDGLPGASAMKCIMPGVQKIIDMGVADPQNIGLHGHSWGGYQTMYMITQTSFFKAAIAGAPVANMTSAYGGVRYGTGLARTFQYERSQSRIGSTLWERRDLYIENSPLFFADRISTPTLLMFGDEDDAVPWTQGIEMYLAMRRLGKDAIFLQYRKEPHHPRKYANRYDYAVRMKEYFDHHLKSAPPASWIVSGVPYKGK